LLLALALVTGQDPIALLETVSGPAVSVEPGQAAGWARPPTSPDSSRPSSSPRPKMCGDASRRQRPPLRRTDTGAVLGRGRLGLRLQLGRRRPVLLSRRPEGVSGPLVLRGTRAALRRTWRLRARLRHRARVGITYRTSSAWRARARGAAARLARGGQRPIRPHGAASRLPGRGLAHDANRQADLLDPGDVEEGLRAAAAIGDDQLQKQAQGYTVPESWTHGSSAMRAKWLRRGLERGSVEACDTFAARDL